MLLRTLDPNIDLLSAFGKFLHLAAWKASVRHCDGLKVTEAFRHQELVESIQFVHATDFV